MFLYCDQATAVDMYTKELMLEAEKNGREEGEIKGVIKILKELNSPYDTVLNKLMQLFNLDKEKAKKNLDLYWN